MRLSKIIKHYDCKTEDGRIFNTCVPYKKLFGLKVIEIKAVWFMILKKTIYTTKISM